MKDPPVEGLLVVVVVVVVPGAFVVVNVVDPGALVVVVVVVPVPVEPTSVHLIEVIRGYFPWPQTPFVSSDSMDQTMTPPKFRFFA